MSEKEFHNSLRLSWEETPLIVKVENEDFKILYQENRYMILKALNRGIKETEFHYTRHILTAQEILEYVQNNHNEETKLTNIYFHLQKLQEKGMVKEVTQIGTGKRPKTYYGRTAKIYLNTDDTGYDLENDEYFPKLFEIIKTINPSLSESEIKNVFVEYNHFKWDEEERILNEWFSKHRDVLEKVDIDSARLYKFLAMILDFNSDFKTLNDKIANLLALYDRSV